MTSENPASNDEDAMVEMLENTENQTPKSPLTLLTIDENALRKIMEQVDFKSILNLRKVCHSLRNFLKKENSDIKLDCLTVATSLDNIEISFTHRGLSEKINYSKIEDDCSVELSEAHQRNVIRSKSFKMDYCEVFLNDIKIILDHQKSMIEVFEVALEEDSTDDLILDELLRYLNLRSSKLKVEHVKLFFISRLTSIIPFLQPVILKKIGVNMIGRGLDFSPLLELEQLKHAERLETGSVLTSTPLNQFIHFVSVEMTRRTVTWEDIMFLKQAFLFTHTIERFVIYLNHINDNIQGIFYFLGPFTTWDGRIMEWKFVIPGSNKTLVIAIGEMDHFRIPIVVFERE